MNCNVVVLFLTIVGLSPIAQCALDLTDDDFSSRITDIDATLVMFYDLR